MSSDRTIVITGAASGLGRAWAEGFVREGATVIAADLDGPGLERLGTAHSIVTDVADADQVERIHVAAPVGIGKGFECTTVDIGFIIAP